jgi:two-component system response regulator DegU
MGEVMNTNQLKKECLSSRELEVLRLLAQGCKNREIASSLGVEESTVRFHVGRIMEKLRVKNRAEAVYHACKNGWLKE